MKKIRLIGLTVVAVLAFSAVATASASAAEPELISVATKGEVKGNISGKSTPKTKTVLETANGSTVKCEAATSTGGKAKGTKESTGTKVTFTGCTESVFGGKCENNGKGGIETVALLTKIGYVTGSKKTEVGMQLTPESGTSFVTFSCLGGFAKIEVRGAVVGNFGKGEFKKSTTSLKLVFEKGATAGSQKITEIEGGVANAHLESSLNKGTFENSNQQGEGVVEFAESVELKA